MRPQGFLLPILICTTLFAGDIQKTSLSGFIKFDAFYDTHPMAAAREGHFALYPTNGPDKAQLNFVMFQSRFRLTAPTYDLPFGSVTGLIEADFFGTANGYENQLRLRHSLIKLQLKKASIIIGQYWTPLFNANVYPGTISFNTGVPFQPFARMPQIRTLYNISKSLSVLGAITMQRDAFQEISGNEKQINAGIPGLHLHGRYSSKTLFAGGGFYTKAISPDINEILNALVFTTYAKVTLGALQFKTKWIFGEDLADHLMLGGYTAITDTLTHSVQYENLSSSNQWVDISYNLSPITYGLFLGMSENLGMDYKLNNNETVAFYARGSSIKQVFRVAPRVQIQWSKLRFAYELEMTMTDYMSGYNDNLIPSGAKNSVTNYRSLFAAYLFF